MSHGGLSAPQWAMLRRLLLEGPECPPAGSRTLRLASGAWFRTARSLHRLGVALLGELPNECPVIDITDFGRMVLAGKATCARPKSDRSEP